MSFIFRRTRSRAGSQESSRSGSSKSVGGDKDKAGFVAQLHEADAADDSEESEVPEPEVLGTERASLADSRRGTHTSMLQNTLGRSRSGSSASTASVGEHSLVRAGFLLKRGLVNQAYKKRWFVLTQKSLMYFDQQPGEADAPKGVIPLLLVTAVDVKNDGNRDRLNVRTPTRVFRLKADSVAESEAWIAAISGAVEIEKKLNGSRSRRPSLSVLDALKLDDSVSQDVAIHTPAELNKWDSWSKLDVAGWLTTTVPWQAPKFFQAGISGSKLATLSSADLERIGVKNKDDRLAILKAVSNLVKGEIMGSLEKSPSVSSV